MSLEVNLGGPRAVGRKSRRCLSSAASPKRRAELLGAAKAEKLRAVIGAELEPVGRQFDASSGFLLLA